MHVLSGDNHIMMQILDNEKEQRILPIFRLAFRPFFLGASLFSVIAMLLWAAFWAGYSNVANWMYHDPIWWHSHEMLFGFTGAIIIGFLLTAVQNWTGNPGIRGRKLAVIFGLWLIARVGILFGSPNLVWMVADLLWMPLAGYFLAVPILLRRQWNNLFFVPLILLLTVLNAAFHAISLNWLALPLRSVSFVAILVISLIVLVVGGRVIPFFTWRGTQSEPITRITWLERGALIPTWLLVLHSLLPIPEAVASYSFSLLLLMTATMHLLRFLRWRTLSTLRVPLLWLLHFAYLFLILGLTLLAIVQLTGWGAYSIALHCLTVGGIGCMILAMIARVSLGHTGRELKIGAMMKVAFVTLVIATLTRTVFLLLMPELAVNAYWLSGLLWALAFSIFCWVYFPVLTSPRVDGRPG